MPRKDAKDRKKRPPPPPPPSTVSRRDVPPLPTSPVNLKINDPENLSSKQENVIENPATEENTNSPQSMELENQTTTKPEVLQDAKPPREVNASAEIEQVKVEETREELKSKSSEEVFEEARILEIDEVQDSHERDEDEEESTDESDDEQYYWQSSLATIGEEEETNSLEDSSV